MRILIHTDEYYPTAQACSYRMRTMADAFIDQGDEVVVIASSTNKGNGKIEPRREKILYSPAIRMKKKTTVMRMLNNLSFGVTSIFTALKAGKVDVVITTSPPPLVSITARQICSAGKRGVLLQIHDSSGNPAKLMIDNSHIHTTPDGSVSADIGTAFSYDITYDDGTHGTIRGTDLIRQIDEENLTQPLIVSLTADQIMAMSLRGVTVQLPQYGIERLFIPEHYVQRNIEQGSCAISLYPGWQYSYVPIGSEKTRKSISGAELAQSLGGVVQVDTSESSLARRVANVERRAGIANAHELGKLLGSMADNGLHSAADFDKQISAYQREEMKLRNEIAELRFKSKMYAATAHNLQACRTYKSVWLEYAPKPLAQKDTFYKQNEAALQAYSRAASQLDKMGISLGIEPEKVRQLVTETESRIADLIAELEKVRKSNRAIQEDKEKIEQIQGG